MTNSTYTFTVPSASQGPYTIPFPFLDSDHIHASLNGSESGVTFSIDGDELTFLTPTLAGGEVCVISRATESDDPLVTFQNGGSLNAGDVNTAVLQCLYLLQEIIDAGAGTVGSGLPSSISGGLHWNAQSLQIRSLLAGTAATHAVNKAQLDAAIAAVSLTAGLPLSGAVWDAQNKKISNVADAVAAKDAVNLDVLNAALGAGTLPVVGAPDNDSTLQVSGGVWATRTPAQARTALGLGTAAQKNTGVALDNLPLLVDVDGGGTPGFPALDGRLLTNVPVATGRQETIVRLASNTTPTNTSAGAWYQAGGGAACRADLAITVQNPSGVGAKDEVFNTNDDIDVDHTNNIITLKAGTYELEMSIQIVCAQVSPDGFGFDWAFARSNGLFTAVLTNPAVIEYNGHDPVSLVDKGKIITVQAKTFLVVGSTLTYAWYFRQRSAPLTPIVYDVNGTYLKIRKVQ